MNLHNQIMNIPVDKEMIEFLDAPSTKAAYKVGHRDARHAASELSLKYDALIEKLEFWYGRLEIDELRKECGL